jgi:hypothetical protein
MLGPAVGVNDKGEAARFTVVTVNVTVRVTSDAGEFARESV